MGAIVAAAVIAAAMLAMWRINVWHEKRLDRQAEARHKLIIQARRDELGIDAWRIVKLPHGGPRAKVPAPPVPTDEHIEHMAADGTLEIEQWLQLLDRRRRRSGQEGDK